MKYALSALSGSMVSTSAVILAGHTPALLIGLGFITGVLLYTWVLRILPKTFVISLFQSNNIRFQGRSEAVNLGGGDRRGGPGRISGEPVPTARAAMPGEAVSDPPEYKRSVGPTQNTSHGGKRVPRSASEAHSGSRTEKVNDARQPLLIQQIASKRERGKSATSGRASSRAPKYNQANLVAMLRPVQQDVLSALMNLGCTFSCALEAVEAVKDTNGSESFDQLFRKALDVMNAGKHLSKKAAA